LCSDCRTPLRWTVTFPNYHTDLDELPEVYWDEMGKWRADFLADWEGRWKWYD